MQKPPKPPQLTTLMNEAQNAIASVLAELNASFSHWRRAFGLGQMQ